MARLEINIDGKKVFHTLTIFNKKYSEIWENNVSNSKVLNQIIEDNPTIDKDTLVQIGFLFDSIDTDIDDILKDLTRYERIKSNIK